VVRRWMAEVITAVNLAAMDELLTADVVVRVGAALLTGRKVMHQANEAVRDAMQQRHCDIDDLVAEDDKVGCRYTYTFTHAAEFMGVAATGKEIVEHGIMLARVTDGRIAEFWDQPDTLGLLQQLGAVPTLGQPPT
jgi:predicted ester cyclase